MIKSKSLPPSISKHILHQLIGKKVTGLVRYSWWAKEEVTNECHIRKEQTFALTAGSLAVIFEDGNVLGVASDPSMNSVIVWLDHACNQVDINPPLCDDPDLFPILATDKIYSEPVWEKFIGSTLTAFSILKNKEMSAGEAAVPSELGLCFYFNNNECFIASHGLHDGSDDFSVLMDNQINSVIKSTLEEYDFL
ncbi:hypothetical protein [Actimicrobium sp. CCI2.3]|uniref:hypothetical protein n=1 Tax=Actimicrobium sp. CCI2.3 TaxID=3048616 RepID=UPI002AB5880D|nr:hypothetical protein [Actimicrobium sp. CCI2.3]MDY7574618.1 hypothetical protein [Actimicrobium sp. CCI2.3]MEB0024153.1 hypothetical protein [Actimicrobium sp. CCI2.3]